MLGSGPPGAGAKFAFPSPNNSVSVPSLWFAVTISAFPSRLKSATSMPGLATEVFVPEPTGKILLKVNRLDCARAVFAQKGSRIAATILAQYDK